MNFLESALILFAGDREALRMMRNQTANFRNSAARFFLDSIASASLSFSLDRFHADLFRQPLRVARSKCAGDDMFNRDGQGE
jgi:hypothetical protein